MGWVLTRDSAAWYIDLCMSSSSSSSSMPTTPEDEEELTEVEKGLLQGHLPDDTGLDPTL